MDSFIERFAQVDADLVISHAHGVAYQLDMAAGRVPYGSEYFAKVRAYEDTEIARAVNAGRCALLARHLPRGATVLDIGAGSGAFVRAAGMAGFNAKGFDVMPESVTELKAHDCYADDPKEFDAVTMWDVVEHLENPGTVLELIRKDAFLFASIPVFNDLNRIRESKHYRPGEHLLHFRADGFVAWLALYGFRLLESSAHETNAGRESIGAFAFCRDLAKQAELHDGCGGEVFLDSFDHPRRGREWFMRCRKCDRMGASAGTEAEARKQLELVA